MCVLLCPSLFCHCDATQESTGSSFFLSYLSIPTHERGAEAPGIAPGVAAIIRLAHTAARQGPLAVTEADVAAVYAEDVTPEELTEVVAAIDLFRYVNGFTDLARVPVDAI